MIALSLQAQRWVISELAIQLEKKQGLFEIRRQKETQSGIQDRTFILYESV